MKPVLLSLCMALPLPVAGCTAPDGGPVRAAISGSLGWRAIATSEDRGHVREWRKAWMEGLAKAEAAGYASQLAKEGALLQPDVALAWDNPPAGDYQCRMLKLGGKSPGVMDYVEYPAFTCRLQVMGEKLSFTKLTGSQRPLGILFPDDSRRMIFLGTLQLGDERGVYQYGRDRERDMVGIAERIGDGRWRLVFPYPHFESTLDVLELVPQPPAP